MPLAIARQAEQVCLYFKFKYIYIYTLSTPKLNLFCDAVSESTSFNLNTYDLEKPPRH